MKDDTAEQPWRAAESPVSERRRKEREAVAGGLSLCVKLTRNGLRQSCSLKRPDCYRSLGITHLGQVTCFVSATASFPRHGANTASWQRADFAVAVGTPAMCSGKGIELALSFLLQGRVSTA